MMPHDIDCSTHGGYLKDIPKPHRRFFSGKRRKRRVEIRCAIWWGQGDNHRNVTIQEEDNPIWNSDRKSWQASWDDEDGRGQTIEGRFEKTEIDKMHPPKRHSPAIPCAWAGRLARRCPIA